MGFTEAVQTCLSKYVTFTGRARRSEFWYWVLFVIIVDAVAGIIDGILFSRSSFRPLTTLVGLAAILPGLAVAVRRLHDIDKSGWYVLLGLIPIIGPLLLIFLYYIRDSQPGDNQYGPNPKGVSGGTYGYTQDPYAQYPPQGYEQYPPQGSEQYPPPGTEQSPPQNDSQQPEDPYGRPPQQDPYGQTPQDPYGRPPQPDPYGQPSQQPYRPQQPPAPSAGEPLGEQGKPFGQAPQPPTGAPPSTTQPPAGPEEPKAPPAAQS